MIQHAAVEEAVPTAQLEELDLVVRAECGDLEALGSLYDRHHESVYRYARARVTDPQRAEDLTSEIFRRVLTGLPGFRPMGLAFRAWLFRIAHNAVVDDYRRASRHRHVELQDGLRSAGGGADMAETVERRLQAEQAYRALAELDAAQREVLTLRFLCGLSLREVAESLGRSEDAVKALQRRGLANLRLALNEDG